MAWVRCCGGSSDSGKAIFKNGQLKVGMNAYPYRPSGTSWSPSNNNILTINGSNLRCENTSGTGYASWITQKIDLTDVNAIVISVDDMTHINGFYACVTANGAVDGYTPVNTITINNEGLYSIDTSNLTGEYSFVVQFVATNASLQYIEFSEIKMV